MAGLLLTLIYICFVSLGLPDSLLGSAWPMLHMEINVPVSYAGIISMIISGGTITSSLMCDHIQRKYGTGKITAVSIALTAVALFGFSMSTEFWMLVLWSIPYGLGAGGVDAVLNNYVALHYKSQHMSWLHCMWGLGASISPYIMSFSLIRLDSWNHGYLIVSIIQIALSAFIFTSLPLWNKAEKISIENLEIEHNTAPLTFKEVFCIAGAIPCFLAFFGYCALELTTSLWASSYLVETKGISPETAAAFASLYYIGITVGRGINGFLAMKFSDRFLVRLGLGIIGIGILLVILPFHAVLALIGFVIMGLGCAPVYPCIMHMTPDIFGKDKSQRMIGMQMAFAYMGFLTVPPLFGIIANHISIALLPAFVLVLLVIITIMHEMLLTKTKH